MYQTVTKNLQETKLLRYESVLSLLLIKNKTIHLSFEAGYLSSMVSI